MGVYWKKKKMSKYAYKSVLGEFAYVIIIIT